MSPFTRDEEVDFKISLENCRERIGDPIEHLPEQFNHLVPFKI